MEFTYSIQGLPTSILYKNIRLTSYELLRQYEDSSRVRAPSYERYVGSHPIFVHSSSSLQTQQAKTSTPQVLLQYRRHPQGQEVDNGLSVPWVTVHASELDPNAAYTLWAVVFNNPSECITAPDSPTRCGLADLTATPNPVEASAFVIGGSITGDDGTANISAHLQSGVLPEGTDVLWGIGGRNDNGVMPGLRADNGLLAEIHYVLRTHGITIAGSAAEQISMLNGGCPPNTCSNQQAAAFPPAMN